LCVLELLKPPEGDAISVLVDNSEGAENIESVVNSSLGVLKIELL
jgi:hypothetical protein